MWRCVTVMIPFWHERFVLWVVDKKHGWWMMLRPDGDVYCEDMSCGPKMRLMGRRCGVPQGLKAGVYRFRDRLDEEELRRALRRGARRAVAEGGTQPSGEGCLARVLLTGGKAESMMNFFDGKMMGVCKAEKDPESTEPEEDDIFAARRR